MMVIDVPATSTLTVGRPRPMFEQAPSARGLGGLDYEVAPDGRFLMTERIGADEPTTTEIHVVLNWFEELRRMASTN